VAPLVERERSYRVGRGQDLQCRSARSIAHDIDAARPAAASPAPGPLFRAAHVALALAFGAVALDPHGVSGFFYHSRMLGIVHLVTLGWITASILGSLYLVGPIALRMGGLAFDAIPFVSAAAWCLFIATVVDTVNVIRILRYAFLTPSSARL
jgi:hypothetical protein